MRFLLDTNTCVGILNASSPKLLARQRIVPAVRSGSAAR